MTAERHTMTKPTSGKREKPRDADGAPAPGAPEHAPTGAEAATPEDRIAALQAELAQAKDARQRAIADFLNYQKRAMINEREAREEGAGRVIESLLTVADYLDMALKQDPAGVPAQAVMDGVHLIREELRKVFQEHGVTPIHPEPGDPADPGRHDAMGHERAEGVGPGRVARVEQAGYEIAGRVLRPAKVFLTPDETDETDESSHQE